MSVHPVPATRFSPFAAAAFGGWLAVTAIWWALAFAPLPVPADWLAAARTACFGTLPNGLPDTWGWLLLVLGPLSMLGFLVAVWGREVAASGRWLARRPDGLLLLTVLLAASGGGAGWVGQRVAAARAAEASAVAAPAPEPLPEHYPRGLDPAPELGLVDQAGAPIALADLDGRPAFVTFAYGHCATMCPTLVTTLHRAEAALGDEAPTVVVVTLDPWRDTPGSLPSIVAGWGLDRLPRAHALSGEVARVESVRQSWGVSAERDLQTGEIVHPGLIFVVDRQGRLAYRFNNPPAEWLVEAVARLDRETA
jgi:protein SCO1/2